MSEVGEDGFGGLWPDEWGWVGIVVLDAARTVAWRPAADLKTPRRTILSMRSIQRAEAAPGSSSPRRSPTSPLEVFFVVLRGDWLERDLLACHPGRSSPRHLRAIQFCPKNEIVRILPLRGLAGSTRLEAEPVRPSHPEEVAHLCLITPSILASSVGRFHSDDCP
jgi:hypothetical protein